MNILFNSILKKLLGSYKGTIIYCPNCKSAETTYFNWIHKNEGNVKIDEYNIQCNNCGAMGVVREVWGK